MPGAAVHTAPPLHLQRALASTGGIERLLIIGREAFSPFVWSLLFSRLQALRSRRFMQTRASELSLFRLLIFRSLLDGPSCGRLVGFLSGPVFSSW